MIDYKQEFFDREYSAREAYGRLWRSAKRYRFRIIVGVVCGMLTAGTLVPLFQAVQPALEKVSVVQDVKAEFAADAPSETAAQTAAVPAMTVPKGMKAPPADLPSWYPKAEKIARKLGISLTSEDGAVGGALAFLAIVVIPVVALVRLGLVFLNQYCLTWAGSKVVADMRVELLEHIQKQSLQFFGRIDVGMLMSRATGDPAQVQQIIQVTLAQLARAPFEILVSVGFVVYFAIANNMLVTLALIVVGFPMFMLPVILIGKKIRKWSKRSMERGSVVGSKIHELLTCIRVIKAYNTEEFEDENYEKVNRNLLKTTLRAVRMGLLVGPTVETVGIFLICIFVVYCFAAHVSLAMVVPMLAPLLIIYKPLKQVASLQVQIETGTASLARIYSLLDVHMELPQAAHPVVKTSFDKEIVFDDVSFKYDTAAEDAVKHAAFTIPRGQVVAVVGSTGSGKSTLGGLLARFFDPRQGRITMDGVDLRDLEVASLRRLVGSVQQETLLFNESIEFNIRYGTPGATHEQVVAAAKLANAHDFILSQPGGYERNVGEKGFALSGGERQRIAIARAILKNPPILVLDEATSALDTVTERLVQDALDNLMANRTTFAIAHRLSTIRNADLILVMDHGEIKERGTHAELYAQGGIYRKLCDIQGETA